MTMQLKKYLLLGLFLLTSFSLAIPVATTLAQDFDPDTASSPSDMSPFDPETASGAAPSDCTNKFCNPLKAGDIVELFTVLLDILMVFALPIIVLFIMYGGFLLVTAQGEAGQIETGRATILWAVVGGVILLGAQIILEVIQATVKSIST